MTVNLSSHPNLLFGVVEVEKTNFEPCQSGHCRFASRLLQDH